MGIDWHGPRVRDFRFGRLRGVWVKHGGEEERKRGRGEGRAELMFYLQEVVKAYNSRKGFDFSGLHDFFDSEVFHTISYHHISILF